MKTTALNILGASLILLSTVQMSAASERHGHRHDRASFQQFRDSNASLSAPVVRALVNQAPADVNAYSEGQISTGPMSGR